MENKVYVADRFGDRFKSLPAAERDHVVRFVDSLAGDGWKDSHIVRPDNSEGGGLRASRSGDIRVLFRYAPEDNLVIVADVMPSADYELATKG